MIGNLDLMCADAEPTLFGILDPAIAPPLMYYSYLPIILVSLLFASFIFYVDRGSRQARILMLMTIIFSLLLIGEVMLWISAPVLLIHFVWQILIILHVLIVALLGYFVYVFTLGEDIPRSWKWIWSLSLFPVFVLAPTTFNLVGFDLDNCESVNGLLWSYTYVVEGAIAAGILILSLRAYRSKKNYKNRNIALILGIGAAIFSAIFILSYSVSDILLVYDINLIGPAGLVVFLATLTYLMVRFRAFNVRVLGAQALVIAIIAFLFAALFVRTIQNVRYVLIGTIILVVFMGAMLIRGVLREVRQRERIERLAKDLEKANEQQIILIHFITHQIKGFVTKSRNLFSMLLEGDYGQVPEPMKPMLEEGLKSDTKGVDTIQEILNAANIKSGKVTYAKTPVNIKELTEDIVKDLKPNAEAKGLALTVMASEGDFTITGDKMQLVNAVKNLVDNSIKYTPSGRVDISLARDKEKVRLVIKDTGVGITPEDMKVLFTEGGHGKESSKVNVESTGFGLYIVKNIIEAHQGKVWVESEGAGKGSTFIVELPVA